MEVHFDCIHRQAGAGCVHAPESWPSISQQAVQHADATINGAVLVQISADVPGRLPWQGCKYMKKYVAFCQAKNTKKSLQNVKQMSSNSPLFIL